MTELTQERLKEVLHYNQDTGLFTWLISTRNTKVGMIAGNATKKGYIQIGFEGKNYQGHRLAWLYMTGEWSEGHVDHENGIGIDNWWDNLRCTNVSGNMQNQKTARSNNRMGFLGVSQPNKQGKYAARIGLNGKTKHIGVYDTPALAHQAYIEEKRLYHPFNTL